MDMIPDINWAIDRNTLVRFTAKPVWEKRVLNYYHVSNYYESWSSDKENIP